MTDLLTTGSVLAAFFAGGVALFAPCCIVVLAPSYLAVAVKNRRWRLLPLTFVFAAGLGSVLVPLTLGMSLLAAAIAKYHQLLYTAGGALMLLLAAWSLTGRMWSLPSFLRTPDTRRGDSASFFALGVFSGIASACCAPVLVGVMTLSALSGNPVGGLVLGIAYVFGMVFPLLVMALLWDRFRLGERRFLHAKPVTIRLPRGHALHTNTLNIGVAVTFAVMGAFILYLADTGSMTSGPGFQVAIGTGLSVVFAQTQSWLAPVPEPILGLGLLALASVFVWATLRRRDTSTAPSATGTDSAPHDATSGHCHETSHMPATQEAENWPAEVLPASMRTTSLSSNGSRSRRRVASARSRDPSSGSAWLSSSPASSERRCTAADPSRSPRPVPPPTSP